MHPHGTISACFEPVASDNEQNMPSDDAAEVDEVAQGNTRSGYTSSDYGYGSDEDISDLIAVYDPSPPSGDSLLALTLPGTPALGTNTTPRLPESSMDDLFLTQTSLSGSEDINYSKGTANPHTTPCRSGNRENGRECPSTLSAEHVPTSPTPAHGHVGSSNIPNIRKRRASDSFEDSPRPPKAQFPSSSQVTPPAAPPLKIENRSPGIAARGPISMMWPFIMSGICSKLPFAVQWEATRLVTSRTGLEFNHLLPEMLGDLIKKGTNVAAMKKLPDILRAMKEAGGPDDNVGAFKACYERENNARSPYADLDEEDKALTQPTPHHMMGFEEDGQPRAWFGGKVILRGTLENTDGDLKIKLHKLEKGPSTHLGRRWGSRSVFRLKVDRVMLTRQPRAVTDYVRRPILLCGSVYRAFYAKELTVFYWKTNEIIVNGGIDPERTVSTGLSFLDFIAWANPPKLNCTQGMPKFSSRFALLLSSSVPGVLLKKDDMCFEPDIVNPQTGSVMTDGAGSIGRTAMCNLLRRVGWGDGPLQAAVQVRVNGSKGLLIDDKTDPEDMSRIYLTPSQVKVKYTRNDADPARHVIDVLSVSRLKPSKSLAVETIINLFENGVPSQVFADCFRQSLFDQLEEILDWNSHQATLHLCKLMEQTGNVMASRRSRENTSMARLYGHARDRNGEQDGWDDDEDDISGVAQSTAWWPDPVGGCPSVLEETVMSLLNSGFHPSSCPILADKIKNVFKTRIETQARKYQIEIPMSCGGMIIADKRGVLEEGEIFFRSPTRNLVGQDGELTDIITGPCCITRLPCKLPSDVQKWTAVDSPKLHDLVGVIVLSTKGRRRAADYLAGGDYDGDKVTVIWYPPIVDAFKPPSNEFADPPGSTFIEDHFETTRNISVQDFFESTASLPVHEQIFQLQEYLLGGLQDISTVGTYSNLHLNLIQARGYTDPETIRVAHVFTHTLDGIKSGLKVKKQVEREDRNKYDRAPRPWQQAKTGTCDEGRPLLVRPQELGPFIMDEVYAFSKRERDLCFARLEEFYNNDANFDRRIDKDLSRPWEELVRRSGEAGGECYKADIEIIKAHVEAIREKHRAAMDASKAVSARSRFTALPIEVRQNQLRELSREFAQAPDPRGLHMLSGSVAEVKASYAYIFDRQKARAGKKWTGFPWDVAFRDLCDIKAAALGNAKSVTSEHYEHMSLKLPKRMKRYDR